VATATDTAVVVLQPGWGDAVQVAKAGILEIADVFVVNKAELEGADDAVRELASMLRLGASSPWQVPVVKVSTRADVGIADLWDALDHHRAFLEDDDRLDRDRAERLQREVGDLVAVWMRPAVSELLEADPELRSRLASRAVDPYAAATLIRSRLAPEPLAP
jgi:LAO/AO transport system kinase